jgi:hypothetical protein
MSEVKSRPQRKPCITCGQRKSDDAFYWYPYITQQGKESVRRESRCIDCAQQRRRDRYAQNSIRDLSTSRDWKARNKDQQAAYRETNKSSYNAYEAKRRAAQLQRTPLWADFDAIQTFYDKASEAGLTVDHVVPLQGVRVSGLHVQNNLCLLSKSENSGKRNSFVVA